MQRMTKVSPARAARSRARPSCSRVGGTRASARSGCCGPSSSAASCPTSSSGPRSGRSTARSSPPSRSLAQIDHLEEVWPGLTGDGSSPAARWRRAWNLAAPGRPHHQQRRPAARCIAGTADRRHLRGARGAAAGRGGRPRDRHRARVRRGPVRPALLASAALPGIFPPVRMGDAVLVDGAVVNLVPISHALAGPIDRIFVLDVSDPMGDRPLRSPLDVVVRAMAISRDQRFDLELQWVPDDVELVVLPPPAGRSRLLRLLGRAGAHRRGVQARPPRARRPRAAPGPPAPPPLVEALPRLGLISRSATCGLDCRSAVAIKQVVREADEEAVLDDAGALVEQARRCARSRRWGRSRSRRSSCPRR